MPGPVRGIAGVRVKRGGTEEIGGACGDKALHGRGGGSQCGRFAGLRALAEGSG
jgi:hypothetical protein